MELLLVLIAEFVVPAAFTLFAFLVELVLTVVSLIAQLIFGRPARKRHAKTHPKGGSPFISKLLLGTTSVSGGLFAFGAMAIVAINLFWFEPVITWVAGKISQKTNIEISFDGASGNLLTGQLSLQDLKVERRNTEKTEYALLVKKVDADLDVLSLVFGTPNLSLLTIDGISGDIWSKSKSTANRSKTTPAKPRKSFEVENLKLSAASIRLSRPGTAPVTLGIKSMTSQPFRSQYAIFDVFFRSNVEASIAGHPVQISTTNTSEGRSTKWALKDFPASSVRHFVDKPPFSWFEQGTIDVAVDDQWKSLDTPEIDMDWQIVLKDVRVVSPEGTGLIKRALAKPVANYINNRDKDINLRFRTVMNKEQFLNKPSLDATGIWNAVLDGTARAIAEKSDAKADDIKGKIENSVDRLKKFLDQKRKKTPDGEQQQ